MLRLTALLSLLLVTVLAAFTGQFDAREPVLPETWYNYASIELPAHLTVPSVLTADNMPADNPITDAGATLGRVLFYDTRLSRNESTSCASCHFQSHGFSDPRALSEGFEGVPTERNSIGLAFARYYERGRFFWDERAETLEIQTVMPIVDPIEMGMTMDEAIARLEATSFYPALFEDAFGSPTITEDRMGRALAQFIRSIVAPNSRYDEGRTLQGGLETGRPLPNLTSEENLGLAIFFGPGRCSECHAGDLQLNDRPLSNGLDRFPDDQGANAGRFKINSLRNIELTAPYMHDGRFETLEEVVEHYNTGIQPHFALFPALREDNAPVRLNLSEKDKAALVAFLKTLTDETLATDPRWSDPFAIDATSK